MNSKIYSISALCFGQEASLCFEVQGIKLAKGTGKVIVTGNLGLVAYESMMVAKTLMAINYPAFNNYNYHLHFSYHATKKEGPSWGLACFIILSFLCDKLKYKSGIAATGEIDLAGNVKPVKYIDEKLTAWAKSSCDILFVPKNKNRRFFRRTCGRL